MEAEKQYPYFVSCSASEFDKWNEAATIQLKKLFPGGCSSYTSKIIDAKGVVYFQVNPEIEIVVPEDRRQGLQYDEINRS